jgi:hypothetical protein
MDSAPARNGVWSIIRRAGRDLGLRLEIEELKRKYQDHQWNVKTPYKL